MKKMKLTIIILGLLLALALVHAGGYEVALSKGYADTLYCSKFGVCTLDTIIVQEIITGNLSVIGEVFNVTVNLVTWNITESFNVGGNLQAKNITADNYFGNMSFMSGEHWVNETYEIGNQTFAQTEDGEDIELRLETDTNERAYIYFMESDSNILGFRTWYDGHGGGSYKIDAIDGAGDILPRLRIDRDEQDIDFYVSSDYQDDWNITNLNCLELNNKFVCDWDDVNVSGGGGGNTTQEIWNVIDNGTFQYLLKNSSNIVCIGDTCLFNGTINISDLVNVDTTDVGNMYVLAYHVASGYWRATSSGFLFGWIIDESGDFLYNDSDTLYFNYTKLDDEYVTYADFNKEIWGTQNITTRKDMIVWGRYCNRTNCYTVTDFLVDTDSNASTGCGDNTYLDGNGLCINFNNTVDKIINTTVGNESRNFVYNTTEWVGMKSTPEGILKLDITQDAISVAVPSGSTIKCIIYGDTQCLFGLNSTCTFTYSPDGTTVQEICNV